MITLAEFMIIAGADNRPLMLEKSMYDSWKSRMELYIENRENGRMILNSVLNGPLVWPTISQEDGTTRTKKYEELSVSMKIQADCDLKATNIGNATSSEGNNAGGQARVVKCYNCQGEGHMARQCTQPKRPRNAAWFKDKAYVILEVHHSEPYQHDMDNLAVQDNNLYAQQDSMILSVIKQMSEQMINQVNNLEKTNQEKNNKSLTVELERYKERVKTFEQRLNINLSTSEKMINSQMDDMIKEKLALKQQIDSLEQNISNQIKEKESLLKTFTIFKNESKEKESEYMEKEIDLEKKIKELDTIVYEVGQSTQTVHNLTKPQKAQWIKPTLYDGSVISNHHVVLPVIDDEETLILEEVNRSKMLAKQNDP
ncbi:integrase, catalytic region, zinc finger, CCHC-type containing protein, partial [Tanacetum coccineum]